MEVVKSTIAHFISHYMDVILPCPQDTTKKPALLIDDQPTVHVIDTAAMRLLHTGKSRETFSLRIRTHPIGALLTSTDQDTITIGRYLQRTVRPNRDLVFHFRFSVRELECLERGEPMGDDASSGDATQLDFFWILCPFDLVIGARVRGSSDSIAYKLTTSLRTNRLICDTLLTYCGNANVQRAIMGIIVRCGCQLGDYARDIGAKIERSPCQIIAMRDSAMHASMINTFCQALTVYNVAHGITFPVALSMMHRRAAQMFAVTPSSSSWTAAAASASSTQKKSQSDISSRHRIVMLRAGLGRLENDAAAEAYTKLFEHFIANVKSHTYDSMDVGYRGTMDRTRHDDNIAHTVDAYKTAWSVDGAVCGMLNFSIDPQHTTMLILDTFVHPALLHKVHVLDAFRQTIRDIASDERVRQIRVLAPVNMRRDAAEPVYMALFHDAARPLFEHESTIDVIYDDGFVTK